MMKSFSIFTVGSILVCLCIVAVRVPLNAQTAGQAEPKKQPPKKQLTEEEAKAARERADAERDRRIREAQSAQFLLNQTRATHMKLRSFRADLRQSTTIGKRSFSATGSYVKGADNKMRLELDLTLDSGVLVTKAKLLQVCDGNVLKTMRSIGERHRLTRRDVKQILNVAGTRGRGVEDALVTELGLGGIPAMLAALQRTMVFESDRTETSGKKNIRVIEGTWNQTFRNHLRGLSQGEPKIPEFVPDRVRVYVDSTRILRAIEYLKFDVATKTNKPMITLKFENIKLNPKTADEEFVFDPPSEIYEEDVTQVYLRQLSPAAKR